MLTQQERLAAAEATLKTAQTTPMQPSSQLRNGRSTLPDVLNARAETSQAVFDRESADGDEKIARVTLTEAVGVEPSPNITIDAAELCSAAIGSGCIYRRPDRSSHLPIGRTWLLRPRKFARLTTLFASARPITGHRLCSRAMALRHPYGPRPTMAQLGNVSQPTWSAALAIQWRIFDGRRAQERACCQSRIEEAGGPGRTARETRPGYARGMDGVHWIPHCSAQTTGCRCPARIGQRLLLRVARCLQIWCEESH